MKIIMLKGLPGSAKTTWAKEQQKLGSYVRVSRDDIRQMFGNWTPRVEREICRMRNRLIEEALKNSHSVIVDDTNLNPKHERAIAQIAQKYGVGFEINDSFLQVPPEECIKRDLHRGEKAVGASVIWSMYYQWVASQPLKKLQKDFRKPRCVIVDIDGTLAHSGSRNWWEYDKVHKDTPDPFVTCVVDALHEYGVEQSGEAYPKIFIVSGRSEDSRQVTTEWLEKNAIPYDAMFLRADNDKRPDAEIKEEIYYQQIEPKYAVLGVLEDSQPCVRMWQRLGLRVANMGLWGVE